MRLLVLTALTMIAFAANSVLNRMALADAGMGAASFAAIRLIAGAGMLAFLVALRTGSRFAPNAGGVAGLTLYMIGFSFAYVTLDAGIGALILFGGVQITMFLGAVLAREAIPPLRWLGAGVAFLGLAILLWPEGAAAPDLTGAALMAAAALGWGLYSLIGRGAADPLGATAGNFALAAPVGLLVWLVLPDGLTPPGAALAVLSGAVTSGLGYALWYAVLPRLEASLAAIAQLTVPVIAFAGGAVLLGEVLSFRFLLAALLVLGGVLISLNRPARYRKIGSKGS